MKIWGPVLRPVFLTARSFAYNCLLAALLDLILGRIGFWIKTWSTSINLPNFL